MFKTRVFDKALDRATSAILLEADLEAMLQTCDEIRQQEVTPKSALSALKRKLRDDNHHVILYSLCVLECWMKNCGPPMHMEVSSRDFMDFLKDLAKDLAEKPRTKLLELIQCWAYAFKDKYRLINDTYNSLKNDGYEFPEFIESDAHFDAETAPEWKDSQNCDNCRVEFGLITRKHHCRNCGGVFCGDCTKKQCVIPRFGYEREVRVCDACFDDLTKKANEAGAPGKQNSSSSSSRNGSSDGAALAEKQRRERELQMQEEEELQLALAISESEALAQKNKKVSTTTASFKPAQQQAVRPASPLHTASAASSEVSSELDRYLDRGYWERRQQNQQAVATVPTAPSPTDSIVATLANNHAGKGISVVNAAPNVKHDEAEQFAKVLQSQIAAFIARLKFDQQRGRDVSSDAAVQTQFAQLSRANDVLQGFMRETDERRSYYEGLQDKLVALADAREALDALRGEQAERRRRQAEEEERQRRLQMASKLDYMRARKHEYLEMQRRQALARLEEQQREMAMRLEQQKAMRLAQGNPQMAYYQQMMGPGGVPPMPGHQMPPGYFPQAQPAAFQQPNQPLPPPPAYGPPQQMGTWNPADQQQQQQWSTQTQQTPQPSQMQYVPGAMMPPSSGIQVVPAGGAGIVAPQQQQMMATQPQPQQPGPPPPQLYYQQQPPMQQFVPQTAPPAVVPNQQPAPAIAELIQFD